jgi:hypothetical protein
MYLTQLTKHKIYMAWLRDGSAIRVVTINQEIHKGTTIVA